MAIDCSSQQRLIFKHRIKKLDKVDVLIPLYLKFYLLYSDGKLQKDYCPEVVVTHQVVC